MIPVLNHQKFKAAQNIPEKILIGKRHERIGGNDPQPFNFFTQNGFDDIRIGQSPGGRDDFLLNSPKRGELSAEEAASDAVLLNRLRALWARTDMRFIAKPPPLPVQAEGEARP